MHAAIKTQLLIENILIIFKISFSLKNLAAYSHIRTIIATRSIIYTVKI